jgi:catechol 2,3-dioxygenase-like lactoylglutathione lyase family enzyme
MTTFRDPSRRHFLHDLAVVAGLAALAPAEIAFTSGVAGEPGMRSVMPNFLITELRTALTVQNYAQAVAFYRDALALPVVQSWDRPEGSGMILDAGRATLELLSSDMSAYVDHVEAGRRIAGPVRFAIEVDDSVLAAKKLVAAGAVQVAKPVVTPWNDRNVRMQAPDGMQITLFTVLR